MDLETYGIMGAALAGIAAIALAILHYLRATPEKRQEMRAEALEKLVEEFVLRAEAYLQSASGAERKAWVLREINNLSPVTIDQALLDRLIEAAVTRLKNQQAVVNAGHRGFGHAYE